MKEIMDAIARIDAEIEALVVADGKVAPEQLQAGESDSRCCTRSFWY